MKKKGLSWLMASKKPYVIGIDLGGTNIKGACAEARGEVFTRASRLTEVHKGKKGVIYNIASLVEEMKGRLNPSQYELKGIGIGIAGAILIKEGMVLRSPNFPDWINFKVKEALEDALALKCFIDNDANLVALGEWWQGAGKDASSLICLTLGTGVGGGIILNGQIWHGKEGMAAEIGHMIIEPEGPLCPCGSKGCLEALCSAKALVRMVRDALKEGRKSSMKDTPSLSPEVIRQAALEGDQLAREVWEKMGRYLGIGLGNLICIFDPEVIVIGGGVAEEWNLFIKFSMDEMRSRVKVVSPERVRIEKARLGQDAGPLGAAYLVWQALGEDGNG